MTTTAGIFPAPSASPLSVSLTERGALLHDEALGAVFGAAGLDESKRSLVYDGADGRRGALMAWTLEYLGRGEVSLSALLFEGWAKQGYPVSTNPETPTGCEFNLNVNPNKRASLQELETPNPPKLLDLRSPEEFGASAGRLPGASNLPWTEFLGNDHQLLRPDSELARRLEQSWHRTHGQGSHLLHHRRAGRHRLPGPQTRRLRRSRPTQPSLAQPQPSYPHPLPSRRGGSRTARPSTQAHPTRHSPAEPAPMNTKAGTHPLPPVERVECHSKRTLPSRRGGSRTARPSTQAHPTRHSPAEPAPMNTKAGTHPLPPVERVECHSKRTLPSRRGGSRTARPSTQAHPTRFSSCHPLSRPPCPSPSPSHSSPQISFQP